MTRWLVMIFSGAMRRAIASRHRIRRRAIRGHDLVRRSESSSTWRACRALATANRSRRLSLKMTSNAATRLEDLPLEDVEKMLIQKSLARYEGNVSRAAQALGLSRSALYRRIASYGL
jgi:DNA-binding NtrC family response regulator